MTRQFHSCLHVAIPYDSQVIEEVLEAMQRILKVDEWVPGGWLDMPDRVG